MALDAGGQTGVRLIDLRHDFVLRQLETEDWQYVSRITGIEAAAMNVHFAQHLEHRRVSTRARREEAQPPDEFALWKLLQAERLSPAGVTLWLTWQLGLRLEEIVTLRWDQLHGETLRLPDRDCTADQRRFGGAVGPAGRFAGRRVHSDSPRSGRPYDRTRLSKIVRPRWSGRGWTTSPCGTCVWTATSGWAGRTR